MDTTDVGRRDTRHYRMAGSMEAMGNTYLFVSGVPYGDIGGGQQPAQLARQLVRMGHTVYHYQPCRSRLQFSDGVIEVPCPSTLADQFWSPSPKGAAEHWRDIGQALKPSDGSEPWAVFFNPIPWYARGLEALKALGWRVAYYLIDDWERLYAMEKVDHYRRDDERRMIGLADRLFATAETLKAKTDRPVTVIPNGYDALDFPIRRREPDPNPQHLTCIYWGSLRGAWFDWELVHGLAYHRPQWAFHYIGPTPEKLVGFQNVMYHGVAPTHWLSRLSLIGDVGIIPFKPGPAIDAVDPIKAYEYLACGLPIVSCRMPQLDGWPGVVQLPSIPTLWVSAIEEQAAKGLDADQVRKHLEGRSWTDRAKALHAALHEAPPEALKPAKPHRR